MRSAGRQTEIKDNENVRGIGTLRSKNETLRNINVQSMEKKNIRRVKVKSKNRQDEREFSKIFLWEIGLPKEQSREKYLKNPRNIEDLFSHQKGVLSDMVKKGGNWVFRLDWKIEDKNKVDK